MKLENKKAIGHIEVIISFIIFIGFVLFLLTFLNPIKNKEVSQSILDFAERGILEEAGIEYNYTTVKVNIAQGGVFFIDFLGVDGISENIIIRDELGKVTGGALKLNNLYISGDGLSKFYTVYSSPEFEIPNYDPGEAIELPETDYSLGLLRKNQVLSYSKLMELNSSYYNNYAELKKKFKIPDSNYFGFVITSATGGEIINAMKNKPAKISIISRDAPSHILNKTGDISYVVINVQAW